MEANEFTNETQPQQDVPEFEKELDQTLPVNDGSFEDALGLPYDQEVAQAESVRSEQMKLATQEPAQATPPQPTPGHEDPDNESVRSSYWQSQADQLKNQLKQVQEYMPMVDYLRSNPQAVQNIQGQPAQPQQAEAAPQEEAFPAPPVKPEMPRGYSREEAYSDPSSDSAKYLDEVETWRDTMTQYNQLSSQYQVAKVQEMYDQKIEGLEKVNLQRENAIREQNAMQSARDYVGANYDLGDNLDQFISEMSDDNSINMDDLVGYFKYKNGLMNQPQTQNAAAPPPPSRAFNQTRRAQAVPTPMNVQSGQTNQPQDPVQGFMDDLISGDSSKDIL